MKKMATLLVSMCLSAGFMAGAAFAEDGTKGERHGKMVRMPPMDCSKVKPENKDRCDTRNTALATCKDKQGDDYKKCMMDQRANQAEKKDPK